MRGASASARLGDDLGRCVAMRGPVHLVLHGREELLRVLAAGLVVDAGRVDVEHLQVEAPLAGADRADALEQLVEVVDLTTAGRVHQPLVVHGEPLHQVFAQARRGPLPELSATVAAYAIPHGQDRLEPVVPNRARDLATPFGSNL